MRVPLVDLSAQHRALSEELAAAFARVLGSARFVMGEEVERFEAAAARWLGARHAVAVSSGTDALVCALSAVGLAPGDEVITSPFTFVATAESIVRVGARPIFVDIRPDTFNLELTEMARAIGPRTRAILPVHLFGQPLPMPALCSLAERHGLHVIEDAAQAFGARWEGRAVGTWGALGCFSFFPSKPLGGLGDGGLVITDDAELAARCRSLRSHGRLDATTFDRIGGNYRLDALQAALLSVKLPQLDRWLELRAEHAAAYDRALAECPEIVLPKVGPGAQSAWAHYTLRVPAARRDALCDALRAAGVESAVYYRRPLHRQPCFEGQARVVPTTGLPESDRAAAEVLSIPLYPELEVDQREHVIAAILGFFGHER